MGDSWTAVTTHSPSAASSLRVLNSWKEIADYLGRGIRTVQRYERELGLPVRRPAGKKRSAVIAIKADIDAWVHAAPMHDADRLSMAQAASSHSVVMLHPGVTQMRELCAQMTALRDELRITCARVHESVLRLRGSANSIVTPQAAYTPSERPARSRFPELLALPGPQAQPLEQTKKSPFSASPY